MTRVARKAVLALACAVTFAGLLVGGAAYAQQFDPQHYLVYEVALEAVVPTPMVDLEDQFNLLEDVSVLNRSFLMNPADKLPAAGDPELLTDPDLHYRWYTIDAQGGPGTRIVQVANQFTAGLRPWEIEKKPEFLLTPASKMVGQHEPGPPPPGQHYDCYKAVNAPPGETEVGADDQFGPHGPMGVHAARYLCAPAEKTTQDGTVYSIFEATDGRDHLACYDVDPGDADLLINTRDQFTGPAPDEGVAVGYVMLCVPSVKIYEQAPSLAPWGIATLGLSMLLTVFWVAHRRAR